MQQPAVIDIYADRWVACIRELVFVNANFTSAAFAGAVRAVPDASGVPAVSLATVASSASEGVYLVYAGADTVANHVLAGRLDKVPGGYSEDDVVTVSIVGLRINETTLEDVAKFPFPAERGDDLIYAWDIHITPSGGIKDKYAGGAFIVRPGATQ